MISAQYVRGVPLEIGNTIQFLFDDTLVEDRFKLTRRHGAVTRHIHNPVIFPSKPWESGSPAAVLYDPEAKLYRAWYTSFSLSGYFDGTTPSYYVCYAESDDGFEWRKPLFPGNRYGEWDTTNVVFTGRTGLDGRAEQVFLNPDRSDPARRFYMVTNKVDLAYSADGIRWTPVEKPMLPAGSDTSNHLLWVPEEKLWYLYMRPPIRPSGTWHMVPEGERHLGRRMALATSPDLVRWNPIRTVLYADEREDHDIDGMRVFRRHGVFFAIYAVMHQESGGSEEEPYLATSRDGINWERTWDRAVFVKRGAPGSWDAGQIGPPGCEPLEMGDDLVFYYSGTPSGQGDWESETACGIFRIRRDRFIGQTAGAAHGFLLTRQFVVRGKRLVLNGSALPRIYDSSEIKVEIVEYPDFDDPKGNREKKIPGFTMDECDPVRGDRLDHVVTWKGSPDLSRLEGKPVYLRFRLRNATLYTMRIGA
jgi:hypothetical protein